jgi:FAD linked oxidases, C-terminal domain
VGSPLDNERSRSNSGGFLETAGIRSIRLYDLRHTAATLAVAAGVSVANFRRSRMGRISHSHRLMGDIMDKYSFNNHALLRLHETMKDALDPAGILSPGKNGIWPKTCERRKHENLRSTAVRLFSWEPLTLRI